MSVKLKIGLFVALVIIVLVAEYFMLPIILRAIVHD